MMKWKCATTKYVSCQCTSRLVVATATPVIPPKTKRKRNANTYRSGVFSETEPCLSVHTQLNTLIAENTATSIERIPNAPASYALIPETNMWCPQVRKPTNAIPSDEYAMALYEYGLLCANVATTSLTTAIPGKIMM